MLTACRLGLAVVGSIVIKQDNGGAYHTVGAKKDFVEGRGGGCFI